MTSDLKLDPKSSANEMFDFFADLYNIPKDELNKKLYEYYVEHYGEIDNDEWFEPPAVNVWLF